MEAVLRLKGIKRKIKQFYIDIEELEIPAGKITAIVGEKDAGKTSLLSMINGNFMDFEGEIEYFGKYSRLDMQEDGELKDKLAYAGRGAYFLPEWRPGQVIDVSQKIFPDFSKDKFYEIMDKFQTFEGSANGMDQMLERLSKDVKIKLALCVVFAREADLIIINDPISDLKPKDYEVFMELCRDFMSKKEGRSIIFAAEDVSGVSDIVEYAVILNDGKVSAYGDKAELEKSMS